jgi:Family of unknown function (DUF6527)
MSWAKSLAQRIVGALARSWNRLCARLTRREALVRAVVSEGALTLDLNPKTLYVVTEDGMAWQAALICPCGCGAQLDLNLLPDERPCWRVCISTDGAASLSPSVWRTEGCRSHFFLREGRIVWVG